MKMMCYVPVLDAEMVSTYVWMSRETICLKREFNRLHLECFQTVYLKRYFQTVCLAVRLLSNPLCVCPGLERSGWYWH